MEKKYSVSDKLKERVYKFAIAILLKNALN